MFKMPESRLDRSKKGYHTCDRLVEDFVIFKRGGQPIDSEGTHRTRIAAMDDTDILEGAGYATALVVNFFKHPSAVYSVFRNSKE